LAILGESCQRDLPKNRRGTKSTAEEAVTSLETPVVARRVDEQKIQFACPTDGSLLYWDETGGICPKCGGQSDRMGNIPVFGPRSARESHPVSDVSGDEAGVLEEARSLGWERALRRRLPAEELDPGRADWRFLLPLTARSRVLEVGTAWGTVATEIASEVGLVVTGTPSTVRARFLEIRAQQENLDNLVPFVAPAEVLPFVNGTFDLAVLNGDLDQIIGPAPGGTRRLRHLRLFRRIAERLGTSGRLCFGAENRYGADRLSRPWQSLRQIFQSVRQEGASTYGLDGLRKLLKEAGFEHIDFYATIPSFRYAKKFLPLGEPTVCDFFVGDAVRDAPYPGLRATLGRSAFRLGLVPRLMPQLGVIARKRT
jgi:hypothetical protein